MISQKIQVTNNIHNRRYTSESYIGIMFITSKYTFKSMGCFHCTHLNPNVVFSAAPTLPHFGHRSGFLSLCLLWCARKLRGSVFE